ncbi:MAG: SUMF1/EgtB/PvdO family nonheme iron enzyme [Desulfobacula sp.]|uniref:SUMF1/EgtB/PvdO family nonheme iron enzyme n=1 Tax=Desulfobacula sp. TaxID=2593537 RepID=UPI0025BE4451|nr:SUMF1/EgtB/PvdO family nonheme iron enzyme [Desulfobacula sp.]MCD4721671.1 SUMF1/EgtB/PvdO family nonheme iron enzyme [Desulfobacula sp.]
MPDPKPVTIISDLPEIEKDKVVFGFEAYAKTIAGLAANKENGTPLVIGIYGSWGSGKTTLMKTVKTYLDHSDFKDEVFYRKCKTVWFQAWKYSDEDAILAALIEEIFKTMKRDGFFEASKAKIEGIVKGFKGSKIIGELTKLIGLDISEFFGELKFREKLGFYDTFQDFFDRLLWDYLNWRPKTKVNENTDDKNGALVIFIDDLDRCPKDKIVKVLETVKLFMDKQGCIFIIGAANEIIEKALAESYGEADAGRFMDKIVQVTFKLPKIDENDFKAFIELKSPQINKEIEPHLPLIIPAVQYNPRQLKRFLNNLNLQDGIIKNKGMVNIEFSSLLYISILEYVYPSLFNEIKDNPSILFTLKKYITDIESKTDKSLREMTDEDLKQVPRSLHSYIKIRELTEIVKNFKGSPDDVNQLITLSEIVETIDEATLEKSDKSVGKLDDMIEIPSGKFLYGDKQEPHKVEQTFLIDVYPVTNDQYRRFFKEGGYSTDEYWRKDGLAWKKKNNIIQPEFWDDEVWTKTNHPVVGVSYYEAEAYAKWAGKRLPTEIEWESAARGTDGREYPWGNEFDKEKCNTSESGIGKTTRVLRYPNGISLAGCYDMAGNVWEWTSSDYDKNIKVLRGGCWFADQDVARCAFRFRYDPSYRYDDVGFRCVRT